MSKSSELARLLLAKAAEDIYVLQRLAGDAEAPITAIGFHAQQAVEKSLKAVLAAREIAYPRTHDLEGLVELIEDNNIPLPPDAERLHHLTQFGADLRYGAVPDETGASPALDRAWALNCARQVKAWAESLVARV
jgi:HEPN domain-containing protein